MGFSLFPSQLLPSKKIKCRYDNPESLGCLSARLAEIITVQNHCLQKDVLIICIGTDRSTGDCLGPLVGWLLQHKGVLFPVYGTLDDPIHAGNLPEKLSFINQRHQNSLIIAVDACLGKLESIGTVALGEGVIKPGAGVHKNLPAVGNIFITGIVNVSGHMEFIVLQNTRLSLVMRMANLISESIILGINKSTAQQAMDI